MHKQGHGHFEWQLLWKWCVLLSLISSFLSSYLDHFQEMNQKMWVYVNENVLYRHCGDYLLGPSQVLTV